MTTAIYALQSHHADSPHVALMQDSLRKAGLRVITVVFAPYGDFPVVQGNHLVGEGELVDPLLALKAAIATEPELRKSPLLVTGSHAVGPLCSISDVIERAQAADGAIYAPYWYDLHLDRRFGPKHPMRRIGNLDFTVIAPGTLDAPPVRAIVNNYTAPRDGFDAFRRGLLPFFSALEKAGLRTAYGMADDRLTTSDPRLSEVHKLVEDRAPAIPLDVLTLDPVQHDLNAIFLRDALDGLRRDHRQVYAAVIGFATHYLTMRDFTMIADQYEILPLEARRLDAPSWSFGRVAVFIHAYYAEMMPEFWELASRLPCEFDLKITTATKDDRDTIKTFLRGVGCAPAEFEVRILAQNRGRDMSSLFITWRDVILADKYQMALRLHSKRTPQVPRQVGESFKAHLFDNLVPSAGYVANLLDLMEAEPDIGLVMPPVIHMGFGTLGHSWFSNRAKVARLLADMGLTVKLDAHTPVAPYGTMYWFRPAALRPMFEREWQWEDYNPEPHHVDGGLSHVQERLIGYVAQGRGYRVMSVMNPRYAARSYAKLEYKLQRLAASMASGSIQEQVTQMEMVGSTAKMRLFRRMKMLYGSMLMRFPGLRGPIRPLKTLVVKLFTS